MIGGTASVISGGKFVNGAETGAFSFIFNDWAHAYQQARAEAKAWAQRIGEAWDQYSDTINLGLNGFAIAGFFVPGVGELEAGAIIAEEALAVDVSKGLKGNKYFKSALAQFKDTAFTNAGRAVTKHPEYFGFESTDALRKVYNSEARINQLAADTLKSIMRDGEITVGAGGRYPAGWKTITSSNGRAASWHKDGRFIGFRGLQ